MAKKKQDLTPEERLAAALVPEEKWPYALPDGWKWVYLGGVIDWTSGGTPSRKHPEYYNGDIPWVKTGELDNGYIDDTTEKITTEAIQKSSAKILPVHTVLLAMYGATIGQVAILRVRAATNQACACGICSDLVYFKFLFYFLRSQKQNFINLGKGGAQPNISQAIIKKCKMPLVSLDEQRRLVLRIESLFAKLDAAKEKVQSVLDSHETRKAALLHEAFTGKLTAKWRKEQGISFHAWHIEKLENLCEKITCGKTPKNDISQQGEIPYLKVYNIVNDKIDFRSKPQYISRDVHETKLKSSILKPNDVIMNIVGPPLRKIAIIPDTYPEWNMNQAIVRFRPTEGLDYRFLYYTLLNPETLDDVIQRTKGVVGQANISITQSRNLKIKVPPLPEQQEIIRILGRLLAREQRARQAAEETLTAIDRMKQSILARAFRGEL